jgi:tRNA(Ile)-lysidine synthase
VNNLTDFSSQIVSLVDTNEDETFRSFVNVKNKKCLIACSGGADSIALALIAASESIDFALAYIEHNIDESTRICEEIVKDLAVQLHVDFFVKHVDLNVGEKKTNLESRAHHLDDYVETFFINLMRGSGSAVAALSAARQNLIRPILHWRKTQLEEIVEKAEIKYFSDPSNALDCFVRNRVRHELIPLMNDISKRDVSPLVAKAGKHISRDEKFISSLGANSWPIDGDTSTRALRSLDESLQNHAIRAWVEGDKPSAKEMINILDVVNHEVVKTQISGNRTIWRKDAKMYQSDTMQLLQEKKKRKQKQQ